MDLPLFENQQVESRFDLIPIIMDVVAVEMVVVVFVHCRVPLKQAAGTITVVLV